MKLRLALSTLLSLPMLAQAAPAASPLLVIHGGAGVERKDLSPAEEKAARDALSAALRKGHVREFVRQNRQELILAPISLA